MPVTRLLLLGTAGAVLLGAGCTSAGPPPAQVAEVQRADVTEVVEAPATVTARSTATMSAPAEGTVAAVLVRDGERVRKGQVLLRLDSPVAQERLTQARSAAGSAAAGRVQLPHADLSPLQDQLDAAAADSAAAGRAAAEQLPDPALKARALQAVAAADARYRAAAAAARAALRQADSGVGSLQSAINAVGGTQRAQAQLAVASARSTVDALTVRAPQAGVVTLGSAGGSSPGPSGDVSQLLGQLPPAAQGQAQQLLGAGGAGAGGGGAGSGGATAGTGPVTVGARVGSGAPLVTVTDLSGLGLAAEVDETDVLLVQPGVPAEVQVDAVQGAGYPASVTSVDLAPSTGSRGGVSYRVRLSLRAGRTADGQRAPAPRPGMSAVVQLQVRRAPAAVSVPAGALVQDAGRGVVFVVQDGRARRREVVVGATGADRVQVLRGVTVGERVVARDADKLRDGQQLAR